MSLLNTLRQRCVEDGGCLLWQGATATGHPYIKTGGKTVLVRRSLFADRTGHPVPAGRVLRVTCGNSLCIEPEHTVLTTYKAIAIECGKLGLMGGVVRSARIAATKRAGPQAKITQEVARAIRASDKTGAQLAREHGLSAELVSKIRTGKVRRDHVSPFAGLMA